MTDFDGTLLSAIDKLRDVARLPHSAAGAFPDADAESALRTLRGALDRVDDLVRMVAADVRNRGETTLRDFIQPNWADVSNYRHERRPAD